MLVFLTCSCRFDRFNSVSLKMKSKAIEIAGQKNYEAVFTALSDSMRIWVLNKLRSCDAEYRYSYQLDSLLCFNRTFDRMIGCRHLMVNVPDAIADELQFILGEKIEGLWYFFKTATVVAPRSMFKGQNISTPLSYTQLHQLALKQVYARYLTKKGEINEEWFVEEFEGNSWGALEDQHYDDWCFKGKRYTNLKEYYVAAHLCKVKGNWLRRDTTQPIIPLPEKSNNP
jgi:hypothetical protein